MESAARDWCAREFRALTFGDRRLDRRLVTTAQKLLDRPLDAIHEACGSWATSKAAYRMFDNDKMSAEKLLSAHQTNIAERIGKTPVVLAIQDTCYFNFNPHPETEGIGVIFKRRFNNIQGIVMHSALPLLPNGFPVGLFDQQLYAREPKSKRKDHYEHMRLPIEEKESFRWIKSLRETKKFESNTFDIVTVGDRESDIYEFMLECAENSQMYVIRAAKNRALHEEFSDDGKNVHIWDFMAGQELKSSFDISIPAQRDRLERVAHVELRFEDMVLRPTRRKPGANLKKLVGTKSAGRLNAITRYLNLDFVLNLAVSSL